MSSLRDFWVLARPFWTARTHYLAWLLLAGIIGLGLGLVQLNVAATYWNKEFYDALGAFNTSRLYPLLGYYCLLMAAGVVMAVYLDWLRKLLIIKWRTHMTETLSRAWLADNAFYRISLGAEPDNPDQRLAEDIDLLVTDSVDLLRSFISAVARIASFSVLLWSLSSGLALPFGNPEWRIPGYLFWFALLYALFGSLITERIGAVLQGLNYEQQKREAELRGELLRRRDHAEQIALYGGNAREHRRIMQRFGAVASNWRELMNRERTLGFFSGGYNRISALVPTFAALPSFMNRSITLGDLMQIETAFGQSIVAMSWFVQVYRSIAKWKATVLRLTQFRRALEEASRHRAPRQAACFEARGLSLRLPDGQVLLRDLDFRIESGVWTRLAGPSGVGKSTLIRTLAGLWPHYDGDFACAGGRCLFLPQKPYLARDTLAAVLSYPASVELPRDELDAALSRCGLGALAGRLDEVAEWDRVLSGGEQQRLAFARALLYRPDHLLLDEASSQLDAAAAQAMLEMLREQLPGTTVVCVTHQDALASHFVRAVELAPASGRRCVQPG